MISNLRCFLAGVLMVVCLQQQGHTQTVWSADKANAWYAKQPWLVGSNYVPAYAINQLEMWQAETFNPAAIDKELGWAAAIGMNTMRVFLHDLLYQQDAQGFLQRIDRFLSICDRHNIKPVLVFFDSVWDPVPALGKQRDPKPGVHNSGWVQSPGAASIKDTTQYPRLEAYVKAVVKRFANDTRIVAWDVWNEPDNGNGSNYEKTELKGKVAYVIPLLNKVFSWARSQSPKQPLTSGIWWGNWSVPDSLVPVQQAQVKNSDIISYHNYDNAVELEKRTRWLLQYNRPLFCTEYMSRGNGSWFEGSLPVFKQYKVAAINWGLVSGKSQTIYPWNSWEKSYTEEPELWFHDVFRTDGKPYRQLEVDLIKTLTGKKSAALYAAPLKQPLTTGSNRTSFTNPLFLTGPDPSVTFRKGWYYYTRTTQKNIMLWRTRKMSQLTTATSKIVYTPPPSTPYSKELWAPELHYLDGKWYLYFAADDGSNKNHRMYVAENRAPDPFSGSFTLKGKLNDGADKWAIDGSVFELGGKRYFVWSGWAGNENGAQNIYIARMKNPWSLTGNRVMLSQPDRVWEMHGDIGDWERTDNPPHVNVNEGPVALQNPGGDLFLIYSASGCWTDYYGLGYLRLKKWGNPMNPAHWTKSDTAIFCTNSKAGAFAPGHNGFFKSLDGTEDWVIYHANPKKDQGCGINRSTRMQPIKWLDDGAPDFGQPVKLGVTIAAPSGE